MRTIIIPASFGLFPVVCWAVTAVSLTKMDRKWQDLQKSAKGMDTEQVWRFLIILLLELAQRLGLPISATSAFCGEQAGK